MLQETYLQSSLKNHGKTCFKRKGCSHQIIIITYFLGNFSTFCCINLKQEVEKTQKSVEAGCLNILSLPNFFYSVVMNNAKDSRIFTNIDFELHFFKVMFQRKVTVSSHIKWFLFTTLVITGKLTTPLQFLTGDVIGQVVKPSKALINRPSVKFYQEIYCKRL